MNRFYDVAITKINALIERDDFVSIDSVDFHAVKLKFKNKTCLVDKYGRVEWRDL